MENVAVIFCTFAVIMLLNKELFYEVVVVVFPLKYKQPTTLVFALNGKNVMFPKQVKYCVLFLNTSLRMSMTSRGK